MGKKHTAETPDNHARLKKVFVDSLAISSEKVNDDLKYNSIPEWDSLAHMSLISNLEDEFEVSLDTDDIIDLSSFAVAREILTRHGVTFA